MFREMRRKQNELAEEEANSVLRKGTNGVLAVLGDGGYPYAVPLNYVYKDGNIYFHSAKEGHKLDAIKNNDKVCFCVVGQEKIVPEDFNNLFVSAIAFGKAKILGSDKDKKPVLLEFIEKFSSEYIPSGKEYIAAQLENCVVIEIKIEKLTGKAGD